MGEEKQDVTKGVGERGRGITRRGLMATGAAASLPLALAACGGNDSSSGGTSTEAEKPRKGGRLRVGHQGAGKDESLDPGLGAQLIDAARFRQLYDQIAHRAADGSGPELRLATSLEPNSDGTVWQLKLRDDVEFHNGKRMTADDVIYSLTRPFDTRAGLSGSALSAFIDPARGGFRKVSDTEIQINCHTACGDLASQMMGRDCLVYPDGFTDFRRPIGTGPFSYVSFTVGERSLFRRNDNYWDTSRGPYVDELEFISIPDSTARANALLGGEIDVCDLFDFDQARAYQNNPKVRLLRSPTTAGIQFVTRTDSKPGNDPDVLLAFKLAADRKKMCDIAFAGFARVQNDMFGQGLAGYPDDVPQREYDPEQAKSLLARAGYGGGLDIDFHYMDGNPSQKAGSVYAEQAKAAGFNVKVKPFPPNQSFNTAPAFPFWATTWGGDILGVGLWFLSNSSYNEGLRDARFDTLYREASATLDRDRRLELMKEMNLLWHDRGPHVIWGCNDTIDGLAPNVRGAYVTPVEFGLSNYDLKAYWLA